jgi:hypothetical protein
MAKRSLKTVRSGDSMADLIHWVSEGNLPALIAHHDQDPNCLGLETLTELSGLAAETGQLEILSWLLQRGVPLSPELLTRAARGGQLEIVQWLWERDCPCDSGACAGAAYSGNLELLRWLRKKHAPWDNDTFLAATRRKHTLIVQWLCSPEARANFPYLYKVAAV